MTGDHGSPLDPKRLADPETPSAHEPRQPFHYGIFQARDGREFAPVEILGNAPLPITHLETRDHPAVAGIKHRDISGGEKARARAVFFLFGAVSTLPSKLARLVRLFSVRSLH
jgi:hypothetical protein